MRRITSNINKYGSVTFVNFSEKLDHCLKSITILEIYIKPQYRNRGHCKDIITELIAKYQEVKILAVYSEILRNLLLKMQFRQTGNDFCYDKSITDTK